MRISEPIRKAFRTILSFNLGVTAPAIGIAGWIWLPHSKMYEFHPHYSLNNSKYKPRNDKLPELSEALADLKWDDVKQHTGSLATKWCFSFSSSLLTYIN